MMKLIVLIAFLGLVPATILAGPSKNLRRSDIQGAWLKFKYQFGKNYENPEEEKMRMTVFAENYRKIHESKLNENDQTFKRGINHLSDRTYQEVKNLNGLRLSKEELNNAQRVHTDFLEVLELHQNEVPKEVDWTKVHGRVGPVKDQGHCGSCWAFATTGLFEGQEVRYDTNLSEVTWLSEQQLIDCDTQDSGCSGGNPTYSISYVASAHGLDSEVDYPYQSGHGNDEFECRFNLSEIVKSTSEGRKSQILHRDEEVLKRFVAQYGPVLVGIDASLESFHSYQSGVYYDKNCSREALDHAVLVVGYGTDKHGGDYWLVKNSWSEEWGEQGYIRMARNRGNNCGIASFATIVVP